MCRGPFRGPLFARQQFVDNTMRASLHTTALTALTLIASSVLATAAEVRVLTVGSTQVAAKAIAADFEKQTRNQVTFTIRPPFDIDKELAAKTFDAIILSVPAMDNHDEAGDLAPMSRVALARVGVGVVVKEGGPVSSPNSTSRRMASGRAGLSLCLAAHASTLSRSSDERRMVVNASCPVVRRPLFFRPTGLPSAAISFPFFSPPSSTDPAAIFNPAKRSVGGPTLLGRGALRRSSCRVNRKHLRSAGRPAGSRDCKSLAMTAAIVALAIVIRANFAELAQQCARLGATASIPTRN